MPKETARKKPSQAIAIVALLLNILIIPGLGSIVGGKTKAGIIQLCLLLGGGVFVFVGIPLSLILIGLPLMAVGGIMVLASWIWGIVTGIQLIRECE